MGLCSSKKDPKTNTKGLNPPIPSLADNMMGRVSEKLKQVSLNVLVQQAVGGQNDSQFDFLKTAVKEMFPKARLTQQLVPESNPGLFNVFTDGQKVHSSQTDGPVQQNTEFLEKIKTIAMNKVQTMA